MYQTIYYWDERGRRPVQELIDSLPAKMQQKIESWLEFLRLEGPFLRRPYADKVADKIYELRIRLGSDNIRILYFFFIQRNIILLHGFRKKSWEIEKSDLLIANKRMLDFVDRYEKGKIKWEDSDQNE